jgi:hypothetical protein
MKSPIAAIESLQEYLTTVKTQLSKFSPDDLSEGIGKRAGEIVDLIRESRIRKHSPVLQSESLSPKAESADLKPAVAKRGRKKKGANPDEN